MTNYYVSSVAYATISTWAALTGGIATAISAGQYVRNTSPAAVGAGLVDTHKRVWKCTTPGTTNTTEPAAWSTTTPGNDGSTTTDGTVVWTEVMGREAEQAAGSWNAPGADLGAQLAAHSLTAGDTVFASSDHTETLTTSASITWGINNIQNSMISVSRAGGSSIPPVAADMTAGATLAISGNNTSTPTAGYYWGVTFQVGSGTASSPLFQLVEGFYAENCKLQLLSTGSSSQFVPQTATTAGAAPILVNTQLKFGATGQSVAPLANPGVGFIWKDTPSNGVDSGGSLPTTLFSGRTGGNSDYSKIYVENVDLSAITGTVLGGTTANGGDHVIKNCKINASATLYAVAGNAGTDEHPALLDNCASDATNWNMTRAYKYGVVRAVSSPTRSNGASDGTTALAHWFKTISSSLLNDPRAYFSNNALRGPDMATRYNLTGSSKTLTLYGVYFALLANIPTNKQVWVDALVQATSSFIIPTRFSSKPATILTASSNLSTDTSTWNATLRANSHAQVVGDVVSVASNPGRLFMFTAGTGNTAASEPAGYAAATDGSATFSDGGWTVQCGIRLTFGVSFTPQVAGIITAIVRYSKSSEQLLFIDPKLNIA